MEADHCSSLPGPLLEDILISAGIEECYLRPLSLISKQFLSATNRLKRKLHISSRNAHCFPRLLERFPNIKHINLPFFIDPERFFAEISRFGICLDSLEVSLMSSFPIKRFKELPPPSLGVVRFLKTLKFTYVEDQNDADGDLDIIAELFLNLEELELAWGCLVTDDGVLNFVSKLRKLRRISFAGSRLITDISVPSLVDDCVNLEEISLSNCSSISVDGILIILDKFKNLRSLVLQRMCELDDLFDFVLNLSTLEFSAMAVSDDLLESITSASIPLKRFSLSKCSQFTINGILSVLGELCLVLEYFAVENEKSDSMIVKPRDMVDLVSYSSLLVNVTTFKLNYRFQLSSSQLLALILNMRRLDTLELKGAQMCLYEEEPPDLSYDRKSQIRSLNLSFSETLTDECLEQLAPASPNLTELFVTGCKAISHRGVNQIIKNCLSLRILHLNGCEGVVRLIFNTGFAKLELLEARGSGLDDESLILIASRCPDLMCLDLSNCCNVTALGVRQVVMNCKNLCKLGISFKHYIGSDLEYWIRSMKPWLVNSWV